MAEYKAVVDFGLWPNDGRSGNPPHNRSGKIELSNALLREMVDAKKRGENVILQVAAWENTSRENGTKYLGCKLSCNGWLMNNAAKKKEDDLEGTYPKDTEEKEEDDEMGGDDLFE